MILVLDFVSVMLISINLIFLEDAFSLFLIQVAILADFDAK